MFDIKSTIKQGWETTKKYWLNSLALVGAAIVGGIAVQFATGILQVVNMPDLIVVLVSFALRIALQTVLMVAGVRLSLMAVTNAPIDYNKCFAFGDGKVYLNMFLASLLANIAIGIGFILLIVPGVILTLMFSMYSFALIEKNLGAIQSLQASMKLTEGNLGNLFLFFLAFIAANLLAIAPAGIVGLITAVIGGVLMQDSDTRALALPIAIVGGLVAIVLFLAAAVVMVAIGMTQAFSIAHVYRKLADAKPAAFQIS